MARMALWLALAGLPLAYADAPPPAPVAPAANAPADAASAAAVAAVAAAKAADQGSRQDVLPLLTKCVGIADAGFFSSDDDEGTSEPKPTDTAPGTTSVDCGSLELKGGTLTGIGQVQLAIDSAAFKLAQNQRRNAAGSFTLFLNGVALRKDAQLLASDEFKGHTIFRYQLRQGEETQRLWSMVYADSSWRKARPLHVALAWTPQTTADSWELPQRSGPVAQVRITTDVRIWMAALMVLITVAVVWYLGSSTSALRDAESPPWLLQAQALRRRLKIAKDSEREALLKARQFDPARLAQYQLAAEDVLERKTLEPGREADAVLGLAMHRTDWTPLASFSLSRTQLALWFTFTITSALFLWLIYGDLRRIDGSLLTLLGISGTTSIVSWVSDRGAEGRPFLRSQGFWADLITGFDEKKQMHRYQAVVVNLLLLVIGVFHVIQQLSYPVFDSTWLGLLGLSGALYSGGKETLEKR